MVQNFDEDFLWPKVSKKCFLNHKMCIDSECVPVTTNWAARSEISYDGFLIQFCFWFPFPVRSEVLLSNHRPIVHHRDHVQDRFHVHKLVQQPGFVHRRERQQVALIPRVVWMHRVVGERWLVKHKLVGKSKLVAKQWLVIGQGLVRHKVLRRRRIRPTWEERKPVEN